VILPDVNVLVTAFVEEAENHEPMREWLEGVIEKGTRLALTDVVVSGFCRVSTNRKIFNSPAPIDQVIGYVDALLDSPNVLAISSGARHWPILCNLLKAARVTGPMVTDAHIAALALEHGCRVATRDLDFARFEGLDWFDPLVG
jgi:toxin-antitoxin system PIN domain toxin